MKKICIVIYTHKHGIDLYPCTTENGALRCAAQTVLENLCEVYNEETIQHIKELIVEGELSDAINEYTEAVEHENIEINDFEITKGPTAKTLKEQATLLNSK